MKRRAQLPAPSNPPAAAPLASLLSHAHARLLAGSPRRPRAHTHTERAHFSRALFVCVHARVACVHTVWARAGCVAQRVTGPRPVNSDGSSESWLPFKAPSLFIRVCLSNASSVYLSLFFGCLVLASETSAAAGCRRRSPGPTCGAEAPSPSAASHPPSRIPPACPCPHGSQEPPSPHPPAATRRPRAHSLAPRLG